MSASNVPVSRLTLGIVHRDVRQTTDRDGDTSARGSVFSTFLGLGLGRMR